MFSTCTSFLYWDFAGLMKIVRNNDKLKKNTYNLRAPLVQKRWVLINTFLSTSKIICKINPTENVKCLYEESSSFLFLYNYIFFSLSCAVWLMRYTILSYSPFSVCWGAAFDLVMLPCRGWVGAFTHSWARGEGPPCDSKKQAASSKHYNAMNPWREVFTAFDKFCKKSVICANSRKKWKKCKFLGMFIKLT